MNLKFFVQVQYLTHGSMRTLHESSWIFKSSALTITLFFSSLSQMIESQKIKSWKKKAFDSQWWNKEEGSANIYLDLHLGSEKLREYVQLLGGTSIYSSPFINHTGRRASLKMAVQLPGSRESHLLFKSLNSHNGTVQVSYQIYSTY